MSAPLDPHFVIVIPSANAHVASGVASFMLDENDDVPAYAYVSKKCETEVDLATNVVAFLRFVARDADNEEIVLIVEDNLGNVAQVVGEMVAAELPSVRILSTQADRYGIRVSGLGIPYLDKASQRALALVKDGENVPLRRNEVIEETLKVGYGVALLFTENPALFVAHAADV